MLVTVYKNCLPNNSIRTWQTMYADEIVCPCVASVHPMNYLLNPGDRISYSANSNLQCVDCWYALLPGSSGALVMTEDKNMPPNLDLITPGSVTNLLSMGLAFYELNDVVDVVDDSLLCNLCMYYINCNTIYSWILKHIAARPLTLAKQIAMLFRQYEWNYC